MNQATRAVPTQEFFQFESVLCVKNTGYSSCLVLVDMTCYFHPFQKSWPKYRVGTGPGKLFVVGNLESVADFNIYKCPRLAISKSDKGDKA